MTHLSESHDGQPEIEPHLFNSSLPVADEMAQLIPRSRADFQQQLEQKLMAQLEKTSTGGESMYPEKRKIRPFHLTRSTIAAAILGILMGAGLMFGIALRNPVTTDFPASLATCHFSEPAQTYTVQEGDTLSEIASRYQTTVYDLARQNCINNPNRPLETGTPLSIPMPPPAPCDAPESNLVHHVREGDTLMSIAMQYGITVEALMKQNCIDPRQSAIDLGTQLSIPMPPPAAEAAITPLPEGYQAVIVAADTLAAGKVMGSDDLIQIYVPSDTLPEKYYENLDDVLWQIVENPVTRWQPIESFRKRVNVSKPVGILIANESGSDSVCEGVTPAQVSESIGRTLSDALARQGYTVTLMHEDSAEVQGFNGEMLLALYVDGCAEDTASGFMTVSSITDRHPAAQPLTEVLNQCILAHYSAESGIPPRVSERDQPYSFSFYTKIRSTIPAIALFTGSLADNREILTEQPEKVVEALAQVIECFMTGKNDAPVILPDGTVAIVVAVSSINSPLDTFQYGDSVNLHAELKFVDTEQYQTLTDSEITGVELQTMTHTIKATFLKRVIPNGVQFEVLMVAVAPDDAQVLTWLIESKVPFTLEYAD